MQSSSSGANDANGETGSGGGGGGGGGGFQFTKGTLVVLGIGACVVGLIFGMSIFPFPYNLAHKYVRCTLLK